MRVPKVEPRLETALTRFVVQEEPCNSWLTKLGEGCSGSEPLIPGGM